MILLSNINQLSSIAHFLIKYEDGGTFDTVRICIVGWIILKSSMKCVNVMLFWQECFSINKVSNTNKVVCEFCFGYEQSFKEIFIDQLIKSTFFSTQTDLFSAYSERTFLHSSHIDRKVLQKQSSFNKIGKALNVRISDAQASVERYNSCYPKYLANVNVQSWTTGIWNIDL